MIGSAPVQAAMPSDRSGVVPRVLVVSMSAPARDGVAGLLEAAGTAASHEHSATTQMLAMPEPSTWLSRSRGESSTTPSTPLPPVVSPEPAELPADADVEVVPKDGGERVNPASTGRSLAVPADFLNAQMDDADDAAENPRTMTVRLGSVLADPYARISSRTAGPRPDPVSPVNPVASVQAQPQLGPDAAESPSEASGDGAPGA